MKRKISLLILCTMFFSFLLAFPAKAAADGYVIENMQVDVVVDSARVYYITETITANYSERRHGIYRSIPTAGSSEAYTIENINVEGAPFLVEYREGYVDIRIGSATTYVEGAHTYVITYELHHYRDYLQDGDYIYLNLVGPEWTTSINNFAATITYPQTAEFDRLVITSGEVGTTENKKAIQTSHEGNVLFFWSEGVLRAGDAVTANVRLAEGSFVDAPEFFFPYTINTMQVNAALSKDKTYVITQEFTFTVDDTASLPQRGDGFEVLLPICITNEYGTANGARLTMSQVQNLTGGRHGYSTVENIDIFTTASAFEGVPKNGSWVVYVPQEGTYTVRLQYTITPPLEKGIVLSLIENLQAPVEEINFTLESEVSMPEVEVVTGRLNDPEFPTYTVEETEAGITLSTARTVYPAERFVIQAEVSSLAFHRPLPPAMVGVIAGSLLLLGVSFGIFFKFGRDDKIIPVVEVYPPNGLNSPEVGYIYSERIGNADITSLIYSWAAAGYLQIIEDKKGKISLKKIHEIDAARQPYEVTLFDSMFSYGSDDIVTEKQLKNTFYINISSAAKKLTDKYKTPPYALYEKNGVYQNIILIMALVPITAYCYFVTKIYGAGGLMSGMGMSNIYLIYGVGMLFLLLSRISKINSNKLSLTSVLIVVNYIVPIALIICVFGVVFSFDIDVKTLPKLPVVTVAVSSIAMLILAWITKKRTAFSVEITGRVQGFRQFLEIAEKDRLEMLLAQDAEYFYNILPYAQVLGVSKQWIKRFKGISIPPPEWYISYTGRQDLTPDRLARNINRKINNFSRTASVSPSSSGGGGGSYGGSGGGGYSSGGYSGGGSSW